MKKQESCWAATTTTAAAAAGEGGSGNGKLGRIAIIVLLISGSTRGKIWRVMAECRAVVLKIV